MIINATTDLYFKRLNHIPWTVAREKCFNDDTSLPELDVMNALGDVFLNDSDDTIWDKFGNQIVRTGDS